MDLTDTANIEPAHMYSEILIEKSIKWWSNLMCWDYLSFTLELDMSQ